MTWNETDSIIVGFKKVHKDAVLPQYMTAGSAGCDIFTPEDFSINAGERKLVKTGFCISIMKGYEAQVRPRSGLALKKGITVLNSPGTIDCFSEDSLISTLEGKKFVKDLRINECIFSFNEETLQVERDIVSAIVDVGEKDTLTFTFDDNTTLTVTPGTLVYTLCGLKKAEDITDSDQIIVDHDI